MILTIHNMKIWLKTKVKEEIEEEDKCKIKITKIFQYNKINFNESKLTFI